MADETKKYKFKNRQAAFCREYVKDYNGTQAAIRAGYSSKGASVRASNLLTFSNIQEYIAELEHKIENKTLITKEKIMRELSFVGFSSIDEHVEIDEGGFVRAKTFEEMLTGAVKCIKKIKEKRVIRTKKGTKDSPDEDQILDSTFEFELYDKPTALINMGKELGMFRDRQEHSFDEKAFETILSILPKETADALRKKLFEGK